MEENKINVKKLTIIASVVLVACVIVGALVFIFGKTSYEKASFDGRTYTFGGLGDIDNYTSVTFGDGKFTMMFSFLSSYIGFGDYSVNGDVLTLSTDDGNYAYSFHIKDGGNKLVFSDDGSSEMVWGSKMRDGSEFVVLER